MYSVVQPRLVVLNSVLAIKVEQPFGICTVSRDQTLFIIAMYCYWIGGRWEITGQGTVEGREIMGKLV